MEKQPNILLILVDEMRGDCLGFAGHPDVKTPYLDTLAAQGIYYPNAYTACPSCIPARAALYTGLSQRSHGRVGYQDGVDWDYPVTLAGELSKAGYQTQCVGKMHVHPLRSMLGFHHIELHDGNLHHYRRPGVPVWEDQRRADDYYHWLQEQKGPDADVRDTGLGCNSWAARPWMYEEELHPTNWVARRSMDFLRRRDRRMPFFLMTSFVRPHAPYDAPRWYFDLYRDKALRPPARGNWDVGDLGGPDERELRVARRTVDSVTGPEDPELIRQQQVGYYACITHIDHQIGRLFQELDAQGELGNTVILFTADHGELLSDHGMVRKSRPYQGCVRVPMLVWGPERLIQGRERTETSLVELRDVLPTLLDAAGAAAPACVEGFSMLPQSRAAHGDREYLHGEHADGALSNHFIVTKTEKYVWYSQTGLEQYFRLDADPLENEDRRGDPACEERVAALRGCLIRELAGREEGYSDGKKLIVGRPPQNVLHSAGLGIRESGASPIL